MRLLLFNPENDLALASGDAHYTPPASALQMAADLQQLPSFWARSDDVILSWPPSIVKGLDSIIGDRVGEIDQVLPWGWSPLLVRQLRELGVPSALLPTDSQVEAYRDWSSRRSAVQLLSRLRSEWSSPFDEAVAVGKSLWCTTEDEVLAAHRLYGRSVLKAPWSGSGRGLFPVRDDVLSPKAVAWMRRTLARQGGVEVEPFYDRLQDFAMEFWCEHGRVRYEGLSLFSTTGGGVYAGNLILAEEQKMQVLEEYVDRQLLLELQQRLVNLLSDADLPEWYSGPLGVDMMIVQGPDSRPQLHPLVEINLRMTMGWVALQLIPHYPNSVSTRFCITYRDNRYQAEISVG